MRAGTASAVFYGRAIVTSCRFDDSAVRLWDAATGRLLRSLPLRIDELSVYTLAFTPDGKYLLVATARTFLRWEIATGRLVSRQPLFSQDKAPHHLVVMHLSDDGRTILALGRKQVEPESLYHLLVWDTATGKRLRSLPLTMGKIPADADRFRTSRFSPDGRLLALPNGSLRDTETGKEVADLTAKGVASLGRPVAFSPDGALLAMGVRQQVSQTDPGNQKMVAVQIWETATLLPIERLETDMLSHLVFTADGRGLVAVAAEGVKQWDLSSGRIVARQLALGRLRGPFRPYLPCPFGLAPNGRTVAAGHSDTTCLLWDLSPPTSDRPAVALTAEQREAYWTDLAGDDAGRAFAAIVRLADAPAQTVEMLRSQLNPAKASSAEELRQLIVDLDDPQFQRREAAAKRLAEWGERADAALRAALRDKPTLEVRRRIEGLLAESHLVRTPETRRHLRAVRILEQIATPEARQVLEGLAKGAADARLTREAKAALMGRSRGTPEKG